MVWLTRYRQDAADHPGLVRDAVGRAKTAFSFVERSLADRDYLCGDAFTAADIMMGFTLLAAPSLEVLGDFPHLSAYLERITSREAFATTLAKLPF